MSADDAYRVSGVDTAGEEEAMGRLVREVRATFSYHPGARVLLDIGYYANAVDAGLEKAIVVSTDGVGTKILVAEMAGVHDSVGIDCVAMNVNDVICIGGIPVTLVDYIAIEKADPALLEAIARGLRRGAELAEVSIVGGEVAQVREMIRGAANTGAAYDLVATCVGLVDPGKLLLGREIRPGDAVIGIESSGLHSNGYTLARRVLFQEMNLRLEDRPADLGRTLAEELLTPTHIYVREFKALLAEGIRVRGLAHITSDGLTNLLRLDCPGTGFVCDSLPSPAPIFDMIRMGGRVPVEQMYEVFNMGVGLAIVVPAEDADRALSIIARLGKRAQVIGQAVAERERSVLLPQPGLIGRGSSFRRT